jgi:hypothetical protein
MANNEPSIAQNVGRGILAGVAGTVVMTAFQKLIEMPLTGREESYAPANFAQKVLPVEADTHEELERLNLATHFGLGTMWGSAYGLAAHAGLSGQKAVAAVFGTVYTGDVLLNTALGLYKPTTWSTQDWAVDIIDKLVQAQATGAIFDQVLAPDGDS